jgi:CBS domain-containing protein
MRRRIRQLMTRLSEIAIVDEDSTIFEAILEIGMVRRQNPEGLRCPAALVLDSNRNVAGFLDFRHILKGLEPGYVEVAQTARAGGFAAERIRTELEKLGIWEDGLEQICQKAGETIVRSIMMIPDESLIAEADAFVNEAIYRMVVTEKDYLFVRDGEVLAGIISLSDVMNHICETVTKCRV